MADTDQSADNVAIITRFIEAWPRLDADELAGYFTDDGCYHNVPIGPVGGGEDGREKVRELIAGFTGGWSGTEWDLVNIAGAGDVVFAERVDHIHAGDRRVDLPCAGVFEMEGGKIKVWRDYFDLGTYTSGMQGG